MHVFDPVAIFPWKRISRQRKIGAAKKKSLPAGMSME